MMLIANVIISGLRRLLAGKSGLAFANAGAVAGYGFGDALTLGNGYQRIDRPGSQFHDSGPEKRSGRFRCTWVVPVQH